MLDVNHNFSDDVKFIPKDKDHDPDSKSTKLWNYHRLIWHKELPNKNLPDNMFALDKYLHWSHFRFGPDCFLNLYLAHKKPIIKNIVDKAYENNKSERHQEPPYTIGASLIFPKNGTRYSINVRRGFNCPKIRDRIDLTLECIRRYYSKELPNPLQEPLDANKDFFDLFVDFEGYIKFFLLDDFVSKDYKTVKFLLPFDNFQSDGYPKSVEEWRTLRRDLTNLVQARNIRIDDYCKTNKI